jgi:hypothetical protein
MKRFVSAIVQYIEPFLAKNGSPIIIAQIENEYFGNDQAYVYWCGSLVSNDFASTEIVWIMCSGHSAKSTISTCNYCNCLNQGWVDQHHHDHPDQSMLFTEDEGWFQQWGQAKALRITHIEELYLSEVTTTIFTAFKDLAACIDTLQIMKCKIGPEWSRNSSYEHIEFLRILPRLRRL